MDWIKEAWGLYRSEFGKILGITLLLIVPMQLVSLYVENYFHTMFSLLNLNMFGYLFVSFFSLIFLSLFQLPFIEMAVRDEKNESIRLGEVISGTLIAAFPVYLMSVIYALIVTFGFLFFIVPGLILMVLLFMFPYVAVIEKEYWFQGLKSALEFGREHFFRLMAMVLLLQLAEWVVEFLILLGTYQLPLGFLHIALIQILLNSLFLPFFTFVIARYYLYHHPLDHRY
jgi:hypothetical protein